jgi:Flp pilus assembly protein CpaB
VLPIITLSIIATFVAVGVALVAGVMSYCFFKASSDLNKTSITSIEKYSTDNIVVSNENIQK